jgi:predicted outer membrane repeat protein
MRRAIESIVAFVTLVCSFASEAQAEVRRVPEQYVTIGAAIAASYDGDVVEVGPGTYAEGLNFGGREITVRSTAGAGTTIVDPVTGRCLTATGQKGAGARLEGFTLRGGSADNGGGVYVLSSSPVLVNCVITGNTATSEGGGVYVGSGSLQLTGCVVSQNTAARGGGVCAYGSLVLENSTVNANTSSGDGGGIYCRAALQVTGGGVTGNTSGQYANGGGVYVEYGSVTASNWVVSGNVASSGTGGGVYFNSYYNSNYVLQLTGCTVSGNRSSGEGGGMWTSSYNATVTVTGGSLEQNQSGGYGGAWYVSGGTPTLQTCQVKNNTAVTVGGIWVASGQIRVGGTTFCGNGVNLNGAWQDLGGNQLNGQCPPYCLGDASGNATVDGADLGLTISRWGPCEGDACYSDFNNDGVVNGADLGEVLSHWGNCPGY